MKKFKSEEEQEKAEEDKEQEKWYGAPKGKSQNQIKVDPSEMKEYVDAGKIDDAVDTKAIGRGEGGERGPEGPEALQQ
jgi:hypothetical protein